ncbi:MAG: PadR family transcriptional regulator [Candidatus Thorarchaeota archaeon]
MSTDMFSPFRRLIDAFREKGATTPEKALTWKELGFPEEFEHIKPPIQPDKSPIVQKGKRYYLSEERLKIFMEEFGQAIDPLRKWIQHTAKVPKGYLRYRVLHKLTERPMSGAELTSAIEEEMGGRWKPKPGSMYPLLKSLLQDGLTQELPDEDGRTRRYELTERGQKFLQNRIDQSGELQEKIVQGFTPFPPPFLPMLDRRMEVPPSLRNLFKTLLNLPSVIGSNPSPDILEKLAQAADRFIKEIEKIQHQIASTGPVD